MQVLCWSRSRADGGVRRLDSDCQTSPSLSSHRSRRWWEVGRGGGARLWTILDLGGKCNFKKPPGIEHQMLNKNFHLCWQRFFKKSKRVSGWEWVSGSDD